MKELADEVGIGADCFSVTGPEVGKNFRMSFSGTAGSAERRVAKFLSNLRDGNGWREISVQRPAVPGQANGPYERLYFGADRSEKSMRKQVRTKHIYDLVRARKYSVF